VGVVVSQDRANEHEEVADAALGEGGINRGAGITWTEPFVAYMGMRHSLIGRCRMWVEGLHPVWAVVARLREFRDVELYLERAEIKAIEHDRFCGDREDFSLRVVLECAKLRHCLADLLIYVLQGRHPGIGPADRALEVLKAKPNLPTRAPHVRRATCGSCSPLPRFGKAYPPLDRLQPLHLLDKCGQFPLDVVLPVSPQEQ